MWLLALMMRKPEVLRDPRAPGTVRAPRPQLSELGIPAASTFGRFVIPLGSLLIWFTLVEVTVVVWSHSGAAAAQTAARWSIAWPTENPTFKQQKPDKAALRLLQYDEAQQAEWSEANGTHWQAYYFDWHPGRVGAYLAANRHSPEVCMTYAGWEMRAGPESSVVEVSGLHLPFRRYTFAQEGNVLHVFHCRWEPAFETDPALLQAHPPGTTLRGLRGLSVLWSAKGKGGQKILEFIIQGCESADAAQAALQHRLQKLVAIGPQRGPDL